MFLCGLAIIGEDCLQEMGIELNSERKKAYSLKQMRMQSV